MIRDYANALHLPQEYYTAIGEVIFRSAQLEYQMQEIIWRALEIDNKQGRTLTIGMDARTLSAILGTLTQRWLTNATEKQLAHSIAKGVRGLAPFRNYLAHGSWQYPEGGDPTDVYLHYMKETKHRIMPKAVKHEPRDIKANAEKLRRLNEKAQKLIFRLDAKQKP